MQKMLTQWGFTSVWDLGSNPAELLPLRQRINEGEVLGPTIYFAGSIFPKDGHPAYLPPEIQLARMVGSRVGGRLPVAGSTCGWAARA